MSDIPDNIQAIYDEIDREAPPVPDGSYATAGNDRAEPEPWPEITPLLTELPPVQAFDFKLLPRGLGAWVADVVERTQCPPDFVAVTVMAGLASLVGRKVAIHPKQKDDWLVTPNLWAALIGRPSTMKSPAMAEGLRPLKRLAAQARKDHELALLEYKADRLFHKQRAALLEQEVKKALKSGDKLKIKAVKEEALAAVQDNEDPPTERRYIINDVTLEKIGELLNQNPNGLLLERDELTGWLKNLDREDKANDRAFYIECFNGSNSYTYDRIGRGTLYIESTTLSIIGGIQPSRLRPYIWQAINQGAGDDGLIQRFQLAVYPDDPGHWRNIDRWPDSDLRNAAFEIYQRLDEAEPLPTDDEGRVQGVRFDPDGQAVFNEWRSDLENKVREPDIHPAIESHLVKYRSLMPSLALIINEVEQGHAQAVTASSALKAIGWCQYLESHMHRIYGGAIDPATQGAKIILERRDRLPDPFKVKAIRQKGWAGLSETRQVKAALSELIESGYIREVAQHTKGRPAVSYEWNPTLKEQEKNL